MAGSNIEYAGPGGRNWNWYPGCNGPDGVPCVYCWARNRVLPRMSCPQCRSLIPHLHPERMGEPLHVRKPTRFLTCFTGDWMNAPEDVVRQAIGIMELTPRHVFLTLTKQPQRLAAFGHFPDNCWIGVSATDADSFFDAFAFLSQVEARIKYLSFEPLLNSLKDEDRLDLLDAAEISWLIIGAQSGPVIMPRVSWVQEIVEAADKAGVKVWLKNSLLNTLLGYPWAFDGKGLRQEMP